MAPVRTKTVKNKHAANKSGIKGSKSARNPQSDGVVRSKKPKGKTPATQVRGRMSAADLLRRRPKKTYTDKELDIPQLNMIVPAGVQKPKGKKKGKVFVDDRESMNTILAIVQADKEGQIESKMTKARQLEEIREARRIEAEKKEAERKATLEDTKQSLRRRRKRGHSPSEGNINDVAATGTKAAKPKKRVSFAQD